MDMVIIIYLIIGTHGHLVSNYLAHFFNQYYRTIENYSTKLPRFKTPKKNLFSNTFNLNQNSNINQQNINRMMQLTDTKIETIYSKLKENSYEVIRNSFFLAEDEVSVAKFDVQFSGSTTVIVFVLGNKVLCANAGDSRAILVSESTRKLSNKTFSKYYFFI